MASTLPTENPGKTAATGARGAATAAVPQRGAADLEKALISIRQARDGLISRNLELSSKLAVAADRVSELEYEREVAEQERDASLQLAQDVSRQSDELRESVQALTEENTRLQAAEREAGQAALAAVAGSESQGPGDVAEIEELRRKVADLESTNLLNNTQQTKHSGTLTVQLTAAQRARDIAVGAVTNAQRQIERLASEGKDLRARVEADQEMFKARIAQLEAQIPVSAPDPAEAVVDASFVDPLASIVSGGVRAEAELIDGCVKTLTGDHWNTALLAELDERFRGYAASAGGLGYSGVARFSSACGELTRWLCKTPRKVEETLQSLIDASALLLEISADGRPEQVADLAGAVIFSVDDDGDNCECIAMSLEKSALRTKYALKSETALVELDKLVCDLIILDVDMPDMNGFELFDRIRAMTRHRETPVIFLSGLMSTRDRMESLPGNNQTFIAKPYNLNELGVIVLGKILKARLANYVCPAATLKIV